MILNSLEELKNVGKVARNSVIHGDCLEILKTLPDNSVDAVITDPPAGIAFMGKDWDKDKGGRNQWIDWMGQVASECLRVIKPGGHALVWALPRTSHWTALAWEDGGWELRDTVIHIFGSGFPKSLDISKAIDKAAGAERAIVGVSKYAHKNPNGHKTGSGMGKIVMCANATAPATHEAKQWEGWGTALKPAYENWHLFRKPIAEKTIAANVLEYGTGGLNIDDCRVGTDENDPNKRKATGDNGGSESLFGVGNKKRPATLSLGRFPANVIHDGSPEVLAVFPDVHSAGKAREKGGFSRMKNKSIFTNSKGGIGQEGHEGARFGDSGSAARFFYCAKASKRDRNEGLDGFEEKPPSHDFGAKLGTKRSERIHTPTRNHHPTVKNTELMRYLCRLITPPSGLILDPFCGSGSTGKGAVLEGFDFIGIEQDAEYCEIARARIAYVLEPKQPTLEERVQWLETQVQAQSVQIKKLQGQQLNLFAL